MGEISIDQKFNIHEIYKKVRILNPYRNSGVPVSGIDPDYQAKLDYASGNFIPLPSEAQSAIYNQKIIDLKTTDLWNVSDVILDLSGDADIAFKTLCIKRRVECVSYGTPTWSNQGWLGNGTDAYIDPLYNTNDIGLKWELNSAGVSWDSFKKSTGLKAITGGYAINTDDYTLVIPNNPSNSYFSINGWDSTTTPAYGVLGFNSVNRVNSADILTNNIVLVKGSRTKWAYPLFIGCRNRVDTGGKDLFTNEGMSFVCMGGASQDYNAIKAIFDTY